MHGTGRNDFFFGKMRVTTTSAVVGRMSRAIVRRSLA
jgi:hypothetical protein